METKIEKLEDNRAKIIVTIPAAEVDGRINKAYKDFAKRYNFPGFRKGKAPRAVIDSAFGPQAVIGTVTEDLVQEYLPLAVDGSGLFVVGDPQFEDEDVAVVEAGKDFTFGAVFQLRLEIELSSYDPVEIEMIAGGASEAEIDDQIEMITAQYATFEESGDHAKAAAGDRLVLNLVANDDKGESLATLTTNDFQYTIGSGLFPVEFDEAVDGIAVGEKREFTMPVAAPGTAFTTPYVGKTESIAFVAECTAVKVKKAPEITDEWIGENFGFDTVAEFRRRVAESLSQQKDQMLPIIKENRCLMTLIERVDVEVPEAMAEEEEANLLQDFFRQLQKQGQTFDSYLKSQGLSNEQFKEDIKLQAQDTVKQNIALDAWARHFEIEATEGDIEAEFIKSGAEDWEALYQNWKENGRIHMVREGVLRAKALQAIVDGAIVTEVAYEAAE